jgi:hypothetical protein
LERCRVLRIYSLFLFLPKKWKVKEKSELVIPVSCTEQGRWSYQSAEFYDSENLFSPKMRAKKASSVSDSLREGRNFASNQSAIWEDIEEMSFNAEVHSDYLPQAGEELCSGCSIRKKKKGGVQSEAGGGGQELFRGDKR